MIREPHQDQTAPTNQTVLICGASFAGLAAAWWMHHLGYSVTIVELASSVRKGGTPVNIKDGVIDVCRRMSLLDRIQAAALPVRPVAFLDPAGEPLSRIPGRAAEDAEEEYEVERDLLLEMLFDEVKHNVEFLFADSINSLEECADNVAVTLKSGLRRTVSLVLGCDGTHSSVRALTFGEESAYVLFLHNYFSLTIVDKVLIEENTSEMFSIPGRTVMLNAYNGKTDIAFCFSSEKEILYDRRNQHEQKRLIRQHFAGRPWRTAELLEEMSQHDNFYFDQLCQVRMPSWSKGRVALVGDAAYCPSPAAGMGGSVAILGAAALADALAAHPRDLPGAFREYERSFRPVIETIQQEAVEVGLEMFMPGSEEAIEQRNQQLGLIERRMLSR